ncbi:MAG: L,D-transpeptidase family protein [Planctomycetaceae bacterium]|nr:L,D-transpeptidase family protein [Planctomycetaceae bacterium]
MEPFVTESKSGSSRLPWIVVGVFVVGFSVWHFRLIPQINDVATGTLSEVDEQLLAEKPLIDPSFAATLDDIIDAGQPGGSVVGNSQPSSSDLEREEVLRAISFEDEPGSGLTDIGRLVPGDFSDTRSSARSGQTEYPDRAAAFSQEAGHVSGSDLRAGQTQATNHSGNNSPSSGIRRASFETTSSVPSAELAEPPVISAELAAKLRSIDASILDDRLLDAHAALSEIYWQHPEMRDTIRARLERTAYDIYVNPKKHVIPPRVVEFGETLGSIAAEYDVPWQYLARLNQTSPRDLQAGQQLKVVRGPFSAVVDLKDYTLTIHSNGWYVHQYTVGTGRDDRTPSGEFTVLNRIENPAWHNPEGGVIDADDPRNPLGEYWLGLGDHIGIHGTIDPDSIGRSVSRGCIHLADGDIEEVFHLLDVGSSVMIHK